ncbi:MAG: hypothetical protein IT385_19970 [Deltaproteobacteria bacterium]|nr:hypothetical protein [Deltaproteobacteria bacterium]
MQLERDEDGAPAVAGAADAEVSVLTGERVPADHDEGAPASGLADDEDVDELGRSGREELSAAELELDEQSPSGAACPRGLDLDALDVAGGVVEEQEVVAEIDLGDRHVPSSLGDFGHDGELTGAAQIRASLP